MAEFQKKRLSSFASFDITVNRAQLKPLSGRKNEKKKKKENKVILPDVNLFQINVNGGLKDEYVEILTEGTE